MSDWNMQREAPSDTGLHTWDGLEHAAAALRMDAGETNIVAQQLEEMEASVYADVYPDTKTAELLPIDTSGDPAAETHSWRTSDGSVNWQLMSDDGGGQDAPSQAMKHQKQSVHYYSFFHAFGYSLTDVRRAQKANIPLSTEQPRLAREGWERLLENIAASGYAGTDLKGLLNNAEVDVDTEAAVWTSLLGDALLTRMLTVVDTMVESRKGAGQLMPNTLALPLTVYNYAKRTRMSVDNTKSALEEFLAKVDIPGFRVVWWSKCTAAGAGGLNRAVLYRRDPGVVKLQLSVPFEMLPVQPENLRFKVPCHARTAGVIVTRPLAVQYIDQV